MATGHATLSDIGQETLEDGKVWRNRMRKTDCHVPRERLVKPFFLVEEIHCSPASGSNQYPLLPRMQDTTLATKTPCSCWACPKGTLPKIQLATGSGCLMILLIFYR